MASALTIDANDGVTMHENTFPAYEKILGYERLFPTKIETPIIGQGFYLERIIQKPENRIWMFKNYSAFNFIFESKLNSKKLPMKTYQADAPPSPLPPNTATNYDQKVNETKFRITFYLSYRLTPEEKATCLTATPAPVCINNALDGRSMQYVINFYNDRWNIDPMTGNLSSAEYFSLWNVPWKAPRMLKPGNSNLTLYPESLENVMTASQSAYWYTNQKKNPYNIIGLNFRIEKNILPRIKNAIIDMVNNGIVYANPTNGLSENYHALPPRLIIGGVPETNDAYVKHFIFNGVNLGYEVTTPAQMSYTIKDFKITVE